MKILKITLRAENDFHTMGNIKGATSDILTFSNGIPYIPGTNIKGVMRTEAERIIKSVKKDIKCRITGDWEQVVDKDEKKGILTCEELKTGGYGCDVCSLFGVPNVEGGGSYREGKLRIFDFCAQSKVTPLQRMHVSIDRETQSNRGGGLYSTRVVPSGFEFTGYIILKNLNKDEERLFYASMHSMLHYGLGGERSRGLGYFKIIDESEVPLDEFLERGGAND